MVGGVYRLILCARRFAFGALRRRDLRLVVSGFGVERARVLGARRPGGQGPAAARRPASMRNRAASGQAEAKWMRIRAAFSTTRAPILSRRALRVANSAQASGIRRGTASRILVPAGDREHVEAQHRRQRVDHQRRVPPLPDAVRQSVGQAEPAFGPAQQDQPAVGRDQPALEIGGHFLASDGWQIEREQGIFGHGGVALSLLAKELALTTNF